jgi:signal transduction histidine kinase
MQNERFLEVSVSDTGIGIDQEDLPKLFRIDEKYRDSGTDGEMGTGLGLILCKELVEKSGGKIWAESKIGKGSIFTFTLPNKPAGKWNIIQ